MALTGMMLHCGGYAVDYEEVRKVKTPEPSGTHYPIAHDGVIEMFKERVDDAGYSIKGEQHALMNGGMNYFGLFETDISTPEYQVMLGLRNSHTKLFALGWLLGSNLFICDNLMFDAEIKIQRKHTKFIMRDVESILAQALGRIYDMHTDQQVRFEAYKNTEITQAIADHAIIDMIRQRAINSSDVIKVINAYEDEENVHGQDTVWSLFNSVTGTATKGTNIFQLPRKATTLNSICDEMCGLHREEMKLVA